MDKQLEQKNGNNKEYGAEVIWDSKAYAKKSDSGHWPNLHYLVLWKDYSEKENT